MTSDQLFQYISADELLQRLQKNLEPLVVFQHATLAQREILRETEILQPRTSVTFIANQEVYTSADAGWSFLKGLVRLVGGVNSDGRLISVRDEDWVLQARRDAILRGLTNPVPPLCAFHILSDPISLGFYGTPTTATTATLTYVRGAGDADDISDSVNPIVPDQWRDILIMGTKYQLIKSEAFKEIRAVGQGKMYENFLAALTSFAQEYAMLKESARRVRTSLSADTSTMSKRFRI